MENYLSIITFFEEYSFIGYVLGLLIFIALFTFAYKYNRSNLDNLLEKREQNNQMPQLAKSLGLSYQKLNNKTNTKSTLYEVGDYLKGEYQGMTLEIKSYTKTDETTNIVWPYRYGFTYKVEQWIKFTVNNPNNQSLKINLAAKNTTSEKSGDHDFDTKFNHSGTIKLSSAEIEKFKEMGWINLKLKDNDLVVKDDFYDHFMSSKNPQAILQKRHPIWGKSPADLEIDQQSVQEFLDFLVEFIKNHQLN